MRDHDNKNRPDTGQMEEFLTSQEVAKLFRISTRMAQMLAQEGNLPAVRIGKYWRYPRNQIELVKEGKWHKEACTGEKAPSSGGSGTGTPTGSLYDDLLRQK